MKYYSKPPEEIRKELEKKDSKGSKKRKVSRLILLADLLIIVGIFFVYFNNNKSNPNKKNTIIQIDKNKKDNLNKKSFQFESILISSNCQKLNKCSVTLQSKENLSDSISQVIIEMKDIQRNEVIYVNQSPIKEKNKQFLIFNLPEKLSYIHSVYILLKKKNQILTKFRAFP